AEGPGRKHDSKIKQDFRDAVAETVGRRRARTRRGSGARSARVFGAFHAEAIELEGGLVSQALSRRASQAGEFVKPGFRLLSPSRGARQRWSVDFSPRKGAYCSHASRSGFEVERLRCRIPAAGLARRTVERDDFVY